MTSDGVASPLLRDPPDGQTSVEASAGTGKTFTLAGLATRYLADGTITASQLLMVTFTRAATEELRARVREQVTQAVAVLAGEVDPPEDDELLQLLAADDDGGRVRRLRVALAEFDSATIITIHGFARQVHRTLGISGSIDPDASLVADTADLVTEVCIDVLVDLAAQAEDATDLPSLKELVDATSEAVRRDRIDVLPDRDRHRGATEAQYRLRELVVRAQAEFHRRRTRAAAIGFDDLLVQLRDALADPGTGAGVVAALRAHYKVALIDEFQDTDSVQWEVFRRLFATPDADAVLVTVGDPKQAIYRFRGADIHTYLRAVGPGSGVRRETLGVNWRSDEAVLDSLETLLAGVTFGDPAIAFHEVGVPDAHRGRRLEVAGVERPPTLELRVAVDPAITRNANNSELLLMDAAYDAVHVDLARYVAGLLASARIPSGDPGTTRQLRASDVAVLVSTNRRGEELQRVLIDSGIPAVVAADGNVLTSAAAAQLRILLRAMARPSDPRRVHALALSWFVGWTPARVASTGDEGWVPLGDRLMEWSALLARRTVADVFATVWADTEVVPRVLGARDGDRNVTDLDHLAELLHDASPRGRSTVAGLLAVLESPPDDDADTEIEGSVAARRIESDLDAVQIMTIWKAKGLEFPVVCVPSLWWRRDPKKELTLFVEHTDHDDAGDGADRPVQWVLDVAKGKDWPDPAGALARQEAAEAERMGEHLRLLYVALTRASHLTAVWWANLEVSARTALAKVLFARTDGRLDPDRFAEPVVTVPPPADILDELQPLVVASGGKIHVDLVDPSPVSVAGEAASAIDAGRDLSTAVFRRALDRSVGRWSFSSITDQVDEEAVDPYDESQADAGPFDEGDGTLDDDLAAVPGASDGLAPPGGRTSPGAPAVHRPGSLALLPAGTRFGTLVHSVLELVDFASDDLGADVGNAVDGLLAESPFDLTPWHGTDAAPDEGRTLLVAGLCDAIRAPLGSALGGRSLADIGPGDRRNELTFDLRLGAHDAVPTLRGFAEVVLDHLPDDDPLAPWAGALAAAGDVRLAGHLTGSIDLVTRVGPAGAQRYVVADYKTNQLTPWGATPARNDYDRPGLVRAMAAHHYPLQALLYSVALHRYLSWRLDGYDPERHLGGAAYLFVRGMTPGGPVLGDGASLGVFSWGVPPALVLDLSALLAGASGGARRG